MANQFAKKKVVILQNKEKFIQVLKMQQNHKQKSSSIFLKS